MVFIEFWASMFKWNATATKAQYILPTLVYNLAYGIIFYTTGDVVKGYGSISVNNNNALVVIIGILLFIAQLTLSARRLHGGHRSAGWLCLNFIPFIGQLWIFILCLMPEKKASRLDFNDMPNQNRK